MRKTWKGRERVAQAYSRVDSSEFERIESSEEHLCIRNSRGRFLATEFASPLLFLGHSGSLQLLFPEIAIVPTAGTGLM
jgi:hypothetical protein